MFKILLCINIINKLLYPHCVVPLFLRIPRHHVSVFMLLNCPRYTFRWAEGCLSSLQSNTLYLKLPFTPSSSYQNDLNSIIKQHTENIQPKNILKTSELFFYQNHPQQFDSDLVNLAEYMITPNENAVSNTSFIIINV